MRYLALFLLLLSGCISPEQAALNAQAEQYYQEQQRQAYQERLFANCDGMGFKRETPQHAQCVLALYQQAQGARDAAILQLLQQQANRPAPVYTPAPAYQIPRSTTTNCSPDGVGGVRCTTR